MAKKIKVVQQTKREVRLSESRLLRENYQKKYSWEKPIRRLVERMYSLIFGKLACALVFWEIILIKTSDLIDTKYMYS